MPVEITPSLNHQEIESLKLTNERFEKIIDKLTDNLVQLNLYINEVKSTNDAQSKRMDYMESERRRDEDIRSKERQNLSNTLDSVHAKIEESELKNEDKIDRANQELSTKLDVLSTDLNKLEEKLGKLEVLKWIGFGAWLVVGALLTKFNILGTIFAAMSLGGH